MPEFADGLGHGNAGVAYSMLLAANAAGALIAGFCNLRLRRWDKRFGVTVGIMGSLIGIHWSLALSATALLAITAALLAFTVRVGHR